MLKKEITKEDVFKNGYLNIRLDPVFKGVFTSSTEESKEAIKGIIGAYTEQEVTNVQLLPNEIAIINEEEKQIRLDTYCSFNDGKKAIIEMALTKRKDEFVRSEYYTAKAYSSQDTKGIKDYRNINSVYNITLIDKGYRFKQDKDPIHELEYYDPKRRVSLNGKTHIIMVELDKIELIKDVKSMSSMERWGAFVKWINDPSKKKEIEEIIRLERGIQMAEEALKYISKDESMVWNAIRAEMKRVDWETQRNLDREEGREEEKIEIAKQMLIDNMPNAIISKYTGLPISEIEKLRH